LIPPIRELLFKIADDLLIIGHRNSEWTGLGPILEEDIAFSSIAQDQLGQSRAVYQILHIEGEPDADTLAFGRMADDFKSCHLVEYPNAEYDFSLIRNFFFSNASRLRFEMLANSSYEPVARLARKIKGELKYHVMHDDTWVTQLGNASHESTARLQSSLNDSFNLALGLFEPGPYEEELIHLKIFDGEGKLRERWLDVISSVIQKTHLKLPDPSNWKPVYGGRKGMHTQYLQPLIDEMTEVFRSDPTAEW